MSTFNQKAFLSRALFVACIIASGEYIERCFGFTAVSSFCVGLILGRLYVEWTNKAG